MEEQILVIDDEESIREILASYVHQLSDYQTVCCKNGKEGLEKLALNRFALIFLDINMPQENGLDVLTQIKTDHPHAYVVMISAENDVTILQKAFKLGAKGFIVKPFHISKIEDALNKLAMK